MDSFEIYQEGQNKMIELVRTLPKAKAGDCGLDPRSGYFWVDDDAGTLITRGESRDIMYFGGFEYVDPDYVMRVGEFIIFDTEDERVDEVYQAWRDTQ